LSIRFNLYGNCYNPVAVGLKPSAMRGEARLRGLYPIYSSSQIR